LSLRESIIFGELKPGTQLKQDDIAEKFGCSPAPVREALRDLESEGLVEHFHNRGVFVTNISNQEIVEVLLPIRLVLEKYALRNAAEKFTPGIVDNLNEQIEIMRIGAKKEDIRIVTEADVKFHVITMEVASSNQTLQLWKSVLSRIRLEFYRIGPSPSLVEQAKEHKKLLDAILQNDAKILDKALEEHIIASVLNRLS
jgi:DNA-binding GntR family transcriptional regulator